MGYLRKIIRYIYSILCSYLAPDCFADEISDVIEKYQVKKSPKESMKFLLELDNEIYLMLGERACDYGDGVHIKHKLTNYHKFFCDNIEPNSKVLDIGCGNGELTREISLIKGVEVTGIELRKENYDYAFENNSRDNIEYINGDVFTCLPDKKYDIIVLSNVLEHLKGRVEFLKKLIEVCLPEKFLIRVPLFTRDWRVPLKKKLDLEWRADTTHETEYTVDSFEKEISDFGGHIEYMHIKWGEIYAIITV